MNKRRKLQKLTVSRETLRHLAPGDARAVAGATGVVCDTRPVTCYNSCLEYQTCPAICTCNNTSVN
jgi:hypothetical protein